MKNPFEVHDIAHLSPSSLGTFASSPALFVLQKVLKRSTSVGPAAHRGTAVEAGVVHGLYNPSASLADCSAVASERFQTLVAGFPADDSRVAKEAAALEGMIAQGLAQLRPYGVPTGAQGHVERSVEGLLVPIIGFYDVAWEDKGVLVDLKTSHALPSQISTAHARQVSLYRSHFNDNFGARICYVTSKKSAVYEVENAGAHLKVLERMAFAVQKFLSISDDPLELASLVVPDVDDFRFNDPITRAQAYEVWGI